MTLSPQPERGAAPVHLIFVMLFWSIEAWLYQNTRTTTRLGRERSFPLPRPLSRELRRGPELLLP